MTRSNPRPLANIMLWLVIKNNVWAFYCFVLILFCFFNLVTLEKSVLCMCFKQKKLYLFIYFCRELNKEHRLDKVLLSQRSESLLSVLRTQWARPAASGIVKRRSTSFVPILLCALLKKQWAVCQGTPRASIYKTTLLLHPETTHTQCMYTWPHKQKTHGGTQKFPVRKARHRKSGNNWV